MSAGAIRRIPHRVGILDVTNHLARPYFLAAFRSWDDMEVIGNETFCTTFGRRVLHNIGNDPEPTATGGGNSRCESHLAVGAR